MSFFFDERRHGDKQIAAAAQQHLADSRVRDNGGQICSAASLLRRSDTVFCHRQQEDQLILKRSAAKNNMNE